MKTRVWLNVHGFFLFDIEHIAPWMLSLNVYEPDYFEADFEEGFLPIEDWMFNF